MSRLRAVVLILVPIAMIAAMWRGMSQDVLAARLERDRAQIERDSLALEAVAERARADQWETAFGAKAPSELAERINRLDSVRARDLAASGARISQLTTLVATLRDSVRSVGTAVSEPAGGAGTTLGGEWVGQIADGPLSGGWRFTLPEVALDLSYTVEVSGTLVQAEAGGRTLVLARSTDPRVTLSIPELLLDPAPVRVVTREPGLFAKARTAAGWTAVGYLLGALTP